MAMTEDNKLDEQRMQKVIKAFDGGERFKESKQTD
jgi:hypothetical protein